MIFACFRRRRNSIEKSTIIPSNIQQQQQQSNGEYKKTLLKTEAKTKVGQVKLAPRTAILQSPKRALGSRITEATARRRRPTLELLKDQQQQQPSPKSSSIISPLVERSPNQKQATIDYNMGIPSPTESTLPPTPTIVESMVTTTNSTIITRPISPVGMRPIFSTDQHDELRQALARRAAKREAITTTTESQETSIVEQ